MRPATIAAVPLEIPPHLRDEARILEADIRRAFAGVSREGDVSWSESLLDWGDETEQEKAEARASDRDTRWEELVEGDSWPSTIGQWGMFGGIGFRYYLPAAMICGIRGDPVDFLDCELLLTLTPDVADLKALKPQAEKWLSDDAIDRMNARKLARWSILDASQRRMVARYLRFIVALFQSHDLKAREEQAALDRYWRQYDEASLS